MEQFLEELKELLKKHNVGIVRSASDTHDLVVSLGPIEGRFTEVVFDEDIFPEDIEDNRYQSL